MCLYDLYRQGNNENNSNVLLARNVALVSEKEEKICESERWRFMCAAPSRVDGSVL